MFKNIWCALFHRKYWAYMGQSPRSLIYGQFECRKCGELHVAKVDK